MKPPLQIQSSKDSSFFSSCMEMHIVVYKGEKKMIEMNGVKVEDLEEPVVVFLYQTVNQGST